MFRLSFLLDEGFASKIPTAQKPCTFLSSSYQHIMKIRRKNGEKAKFSQVSCVTIVSTRTANGDAKNRHLLYKYFFITVINIDLWVFKVS